MFAERTWPSAEAMYLMNSLARSFFFDDETIDIDSDHWMPPSSGTHASTGTPSFLSSSVIQSPTPGITAAEPLVSEPNVSAIE